MRLISESLVNKGHLFALSACLSAWYCTQTDRALPLALAIAYGLYLLLGKHWRLLIGLALVWLIIAADAMFLQERGTVFTGREGALTGMISDLPSFDGNQVVYLFKTTHGESVRVLEKVATKAEKQRLQRLLVPGLVCRINGKMEKPPTPGNLHAFNYRLYLRQHHIYWSLETATVPAVAGYDQTVISRLKRFRQRQIDDVDRQLSVTSAEMIASLVFGDDQLLDPELYSAYQYLGLVHLLVVSGMHIAVVFGSLFYILRRIGVIREAAVCLFLLLIPAYVLLTGAEPSIIRSGLTACLLLIASLIQLRFLRPNDILSLSCLLMIACDPKVIFDLGFQLSFAATFTLIVAGPSLLAKYKSPASRLFVLAILSELAVFPIIISHFYRLSLLSFLLSVVYVPYLSYIILPLSSLVYLLVSVFPSLSVICSQLLDGFLDRPQQLLLYLFQHPSDQLNYGALSGPVLLFAVTLIALSFCAWERCKSKYAAAILIAPFFIIYFVIVLAAIARPDGAVTFINVGQGDSILVQLPHQRGNLLIDTGGTLHYKQPAWMQRRQSFDVGRTILLPELRALRVDCIDVLVLTHRDTDHIGGLASLVGQVTIKRIVVSPFFNPRASDLRLFQKAATQGTRLSLAQAGDVLRLGGASFHILSPAARAPDSNDNSLVIRTRLGGKEWLFTGDLSENGEKQLLEKRLAVRADVLKLGHHGSRSATSVQWLNNVRPAIAIVSCGKNNRYGHPHPEVIERLKARGIHILRTDVSGDLRFDFSDQAITAVETAE
ncbi:MAG: DNA internalization-related competence protein ComEC/Rec2 [Sporolactobacillus sp.]